MSEIYKSEKSTERASAGDIVVAGDLKARGISIQANLQEIQRDRASPFQERSSTLESIKAFGAKIGKQIKKAVKEGAADFKERLDFWLKYGNKGDDIVRAIMGAMAVTLPVGLVAAGITGSVAYLAVPLGIEFVAFLSTFFLNEIIDQVVNGY